MRKQLFNLFLCCNVQAVRIQHDVCRSIKIHVDELDLETFTFTFTEALY